VKIIKPIRHIVEGTDTRSARAFDVTIQALIVLSLISFPIETLPGLPNWTYAALRVFEVLSVTVFTIEYALRMIVAESTLGFAFSFFGVIDLLAILPFYVATGVDLRALRAARLFRLLRLLKLARYNDAVKQFGQAVRSIREELVLFFILSGMLVYLAASGIYYFEHPAQPETFASVPHSLWWAVATLTTVGYGDIYPVTVGGKIFTTLILFVGLGIVSIPTGLLASALTETVGEG